MKILKRGKKSPGGFNRYYFPVKNTTNNKEQLSLSHKTNSEYLDNSGYLDSNANFMTS